MTDLTQWPHNGMPHPSKPLVYTTEELLARKKSDCVAQIDAAVLAIYNRPMALSQEYEAREQAAADYKSAGYVGPVPPRLDGFAIPASMTAAAAADLILSQAARMRGALGLLSDLRMRKYEVLRAGTEDEATAAHEDIMAQISAVASSL